MTFYQELQLSSTGSKQLIKNTTDPKEKRRHILIYNFKVYLVMIFCVAVVSLYSKFIGNDNSVVGVTVLLPDLATQSLVNGRHTDIQAIPAHIALGSPRRFINSIALDTMNVSFRYHLPRAE